MKSVFRQNGLKTILTLFLVVLLHFGFSNEGVVISIDVSPSILNLQKKGQVVTVHTNINYYLVAASSVTLNGIEISTWKSDDRGNFVAKFLMEAIKDLPLLIDGYNTLTLTGTTVEGTIFQGSEEIKVIEVIPAGRK